MKTQLADILNVRCSVGFKQFAKKGALSKLSTIFILERHFEKNEDLSGLVGLAGRRGLRT